MNKIENKDKLRGWFEKLQCRTQESSKREGKEEEEMFVEAKSELCFLHAAPQHGGDIETNLMTT
jgi:hypothetical protein